MNAENITADSIMRGIADLEVMKKTLGQSLRDARLELGVHRLKLSAAMKVPQEVIRQIESGDPKVSIDLHFTALLGLGVPSADIARLILEGV